MAIIDELEQIIQKNEDLRIELNRKKNALNKAIAISLDDGVYIPNFDVDTSIEHPNTRYKIELKKGVKATDGVRPNIGHVLFEDNPYWKVMNINLDNTISAKLTIPEDQKKEYQQLKNEIFNQKNLIEVLKEDLELERSGIAKRENNIEDEAFYSLWFNKNEEITPIFRYNGQNLEYLYVTNKDDPLAIKTVSPHNERLTEEMLNSADALKSGFFYTEDGKKIPRRVLQNAKDKFHQVETGTRILPRSLIPERSRNGGIRKKKGFKRPEYRHWGQEYLHSLNPEDATDGELLGSGGSYKAFVYDDVTIAEFDQPKRATFFFETDFFKNLKEWHREKIHREKPEGYIGRINHPRKKSIDNSQWKHDVHYSLVFSEYIPWPEGYKKQK